MPTFRTIAIALIAASAIPANAIPAGAGTLTPNTGAVEIAPPVAAGGPATQAFKAADARMMAKLGAPLSGDPDRDFVTGMLPHHEGAVDMANVELRYGKDPVLRRLAAAIIKAQDQEIAEMQAWRVKHP